MEIEATSEVRGTPLSEGSNMPPRFDIPFSLQADPAVEELAALFAAAILRLRARRFLPPPESSPKLSETPTDGLELSSEMPLSV